jgi:hypothetical protein
MDRADRGTGKQERASTQAMPLRGSVILPFPHRRTTLLNEKPARRALRIPIGASRLLVVLSAAALGAAACSKTPDSPGGPGRAAPKTAVTVPATRPAPAESAGAIRIPASPADNSSGVLQRRPARIWI